MTSGNLLLKTLITHFFTSNICPNIKPNFLQGSAFLCTEARLRTESTHNHTCLLQLWWTTLRLQLLHKQQTCRLVCNGEVCEVSDRKEETEEGDGKGVV